MLEIKIPDAMFAEGAAFEGKELTAQFILDLASNKTHMTIVTKQPIYIEDWNFRPHDARAYVDALQSIDKGFVQIKKDGVLLTPETAVELFQTYWQEL